MVAPFSSALRLLGVVAPMILYTIIGKAEAAERTPHAVATLDFTFLPVKKYLSKLLAEHSPNSEECPNNDETRKGIEEGFINFTRLYHSDDYPREEASDYAAMPLMIYMSVLLMLAFIFIGICWCLFRCCWRCTDCCNPVLSASKSKRRRKENVCIFWYSFALACFIAATILRVVSVLDIPKLGNTVSEQWVDPLHLYLKNLGTRLHYASEDNQVKDVTDKVIDTAFETLDDTITDAIKSVADYLEKRLDKLWEFVKEMVTAINAKDKDDNVKAAVGASVSYTERSKEYTEKKYNGGKSLEDKLGEFVVDSKEMKSIFEASATDGKIDGVPIENIIAPIEKIIDIIDELDLNELDEIFEAINNGDFSKLFGGLAENKEGENGSKSAENSLTPRNKENKDDGSKGSISAAEDVSIRLDLISKGLEAVVKMLDIRAMIENILNIEDKKEGDSDKDGVAVREKGDNGDSLIDKKELVEGVLECFFMDGEFSKVVDCLLDELKSMVKIDGLKERLENEVSGDAQEEIRDALNDIAEQLDDAEEDVDKYMGYVRRVLHGEIGELLVDLEVVEEDAGDKIKKYMAYSKWAIIGSIVLSAFLIFILPISVALCCVCRNRKKGKCQCKACIKCSVCCTAPCTILTMIILSVVGLGLAVVYYIALAEILSTDESTFEATQGSEKPPIGEVFSKCVTKDYLRKKELFKKIVDSDSYDPSYEAPGNIMSRARSLAKLGFGKAEILSIIASEYLVNRGVGKLTKYIDSKDIGDDLKDELIELAEDTISSILSCERKTTSKIDKNNLRFKQDKNNKDYDDSEYISKYGNFLSALGLDTNLGRIYDAVVTPSLFTDALDMDRCDASPQDPILCLIDKELVGDDGKGGAMRELRDTLRGITEGNGDLFDLSIDSNGDMPFKIGKGFYPLNDYIKFFSTEPRDDSNKLNEIYCTCPLVVIFSGYLRANKAYIFGKSSVLCPGTSDPTVENCNILKDLYRFIQASDEGSTSGEVYYKDDPKSCQDIFNNGDASSDTYKLRYHSVYEILSALNEKLFGCSNAGDPDCTSKDVCDSKFPVDDDSPTSRGNYSINSLCKKTKAYIDVADDIYELLNITEEEYDTFFDELNAFVNKLEESVRKFVNDEDGYPELTVELVQKDDLKIMTGLIESVKNAVLNLQTKIGDISGDELGGLLTCYPIGVTKDNIVGSINELSHIRTMELVALLLTVVAILVMLVVANCGPMVYHERYKRKYCCCCHKSRPPQQRRRDGNNLRRDVENERRSRERRPSRNDRSYRRPSSQATQPPHPRPIDDASVGVNGPSPIIEIKVGSGGGMDTTIRTSAGPSAYRRDYPNSGTDVDMYGSSRGSSARYDNTYSTNGPNEIYSSRNIYSDRESFDMGRPQRRRR